MQAGLAVTALLMGLAGGPHCVAMCGVACAAIGRSRPASTARSMWTFQAGRLLGYTSLGAVSATSVQALGWLTVHSAVIRPVWTLFHVAAALLGLMLVWQAHQPIWLEEGARKVWSRMRLLAGGSVGGAPLLTGCLWCFLPCGLLYSALLVAALSGNVASGAAVMALFAVGSGLSLMAGPWLWLRLGCPGTGQWSVRLAGAALFLISAGALWMGLAHNAAPWCLTS